MVRSIIRSRILMGILCILFLILSIRAASKSCNAFEKEKAHRSHFHIATGINLNHSSMPRIPLENVCPCSSSENSCCRCDIKSTTKNSHISLLCGNTLRQLSVLYATMIKPSAYIPLSQKEICFHDFNSSLQKEFFLVNCTFLI